MADVVVVGCLPFLRFEITRHVFSLSQESEMVRRTCCQSGSSK